MDEREMGLKPLDGYHLKGLLRQFPAQYTLEFSQPLRR
jgi:hypothetical protein